MSELISRLKEIIEKYNAGCYNETCNPFESCTDCVLKQIREVIESQPPADSGPDTNVGTNQWIPCSERLPDTEEEVWVILGYTYTSDCTQKSIARYIRFENGESHWRDNKLGYLEWEKYSDGHGGRSSYKVLAWMPAEPYKGE